MRKSSIVCLLVLLILTTAAEAQRRQLHFDIQDVTVSGRLVYRTFYGPPNYGQTPKRDSRETQPILLLDSAVDVSGDHRDPLNETERDVKAITLVSDRSLRSFIGKRIVAKGMLFHAHTGHHHTKVLMSVSSVKRK